MAQFETLTYFLQNLLQRRPSLVVELAPEFARAIAEHERSLAPTYLGDAALFGDHAGDDESVLEVSERAYLETYRGVHVPIVALDSNGKPYLFGVPSSLYQDALLSLIEDPSGEGDQSSGPKTVAQLLALFPDLDEATLRAFLTPENPNFERTARGWRCAWSSVSLHVQATRAMTRRFVHVIVRSEAWHNRSEAELMEGVPSGPVVTDPGPPAATDVTSADQRYFLSWVPEWRSEFLQASRILARGRHADEVAQRLLYRLQHGLRLRGESLRDVRVLVTVTTPGLLLATALHRWWPSTLPSIEETDAAIQEGDPVGSASRVTLTKPAVVDLSHFVFDSEESELPAVATSGGCVLVQDLVMSESSSRRVALNLRRGGTDVLGILVLARFRLDQSREGRERTGEGDEQPSLDRITDITEGWSVPPGQVPLHAMFDLLRPISPAATDDRDRDPTLTYWIDPRARRPLRFSTLWRDFAPNRDPDLRRRNEVLARFDETDGQSLVSTGHFVHGKRHLQVAVNVREALSGSIGTEIANWLADVCTGTRGRGEVPWEKPSGRSLRGDVTAVLMPVHSQIHYLWPQVEARLAQLGRRQSMWQLEPALITEKGPVYRLPAQVEELVGELVRRGKPARILVLDDALASGRTATSILATLMRLADRVGHGRDAPAFAWIRYFALLDQRDREANTVWSKIQHLGNVRVEIEAFAPLMGIAVYDEDNCPACRERRQLRRLRERCRLASAPDAENWATGALHRLRLVAVDAPGMRRPQPPLDEPFDVLGSYPNAEPKHPRPRVRHADTAVWRFYELIESSCPPSHLLRSLEHAWPRPNASPETALQYQRYRRAVYRWCLSHWRRIQSDHGEGAFLESAARELAQDTELLPELLAGIAQHADEPELVEFLRLCVKRLVDLEAMQASRGSTFAVEGQVLHLETAVKIFFLGLESHDVTRAVQAELLAYLRKSLEDRELSDVSLAGVLWRRLSGLRSADPHWALETIAEALFRGRDADGRLISSHWLLPYLADQVIQGHRSSTDLRILHSALASFISALDALGLYYSPAATLLALETKVRSESALRWVERQLAQADLDDSGEELEILMESLALDHKFVRDFIAHFEPSLDDVEKDLNQRADELKQAVGLEWRLAGETGGAERLLVARERLVLALSNQALEPRADSRVESSRPYSSRITAERHTSRILRITILTQFPLRDGDGDVGVDSRKMGIEEGLLTPFGVQFHAWTRAEAAEQEEGYLLKRYVDVPSGLTPRASVG